METSPRVAERATYELLPIDQVHPDPDNPRRTYFRLQELADSLKERGMLQPIVCRVDPNGRRIIMYGHRRHRAAQIAGWTAVPVITRHNVIDAGVLADQLTENTHRENMDPIDEALGIRRFMHENKIASYAEAAARLGHSIPWVTNRIACLDLDEDEQDRVRARSLSVVDGARIARSRNGTTRTRQTNEREPAWKGDLTRASRNSVILDNAPSLSASLGLTSTRSQGSPATPDAKGAPLPAADWFSTEHPLAARARGRCKLRHGQRRTLPGGVACAECWEVTIRRDERLHPTEDPG